MERGSQRQTAPTPVWGKCTLLLDHDHHSFLVVPCQDSVVHSNKAGASDALYSVLSEGQVTSYCALSRCWCGTLGWMHHEQKDSALNFARVHLQKRRIFRGVRQLQAKGMQNKRLLRCMRRQIASVEMEIGLSIADGRGRRCTCCHTRCLCAVASTTPGHVVLPYRGAGGCGVFGCGL